MGQTLPAASLRRRPCAAPSKPAPSAGAHSLSRRGIHPQTVAKWRKRAAPVDAPLGAKVPRSTVRSTEEEARVVAFRRQHPSAHHRAPEPLGVAPMLLKLPL